MRVVHLVCSIVLLAMPGCQSTLQVSRHDLRQPVDSEMDAGKVLVFLPEHEFVVTNLALTEDGSPADRLEYQISLVTRPDRERGFLVRNVPAPLAQSSFTILLDQQGALEQLSGDVTDRTLETTQALVSLIPIAAALLQAEIDAERKADPELMKHKAAKKQLLDALESAADPDAIKTIQEALQLTLTRIAERQAILTQSPKKSRGVKPFGEAEEVPILPVEDEKEHEKTIALIKEKGYDHEKPHVYIVLVPVERGDGQ